MTEIIQAALIGGFAGAVVSGFFALVTTVLHNLYAEKRRKAEERKWYAEYFLGRKIEALSELYSSMIQLTLGLSPFLSGAIIDQNSVEELNSRINHFASTMGLGMVYIEPQEFEAFTELGTHMTEFLELARDAEERNAQTFVIVKDDDLAHQVPDGTVVLNLRDVLAKFRETREILERALSPNVLKGIMPEE